VRAFVARSQREQSEVHDLMLAMNGGVPSTSRPSGATTMRARFRGGVLAVLAARRLQAGPRKATVYGQLVQVRDEHFSIIDDRQINEDDSQ
jgi:hypothetical protein